MTDTEAEKILRGAEYWHYEFELPWGKTVPGKPGWADRVRKRRSHFFQPLVDRGAFKGKLVYDLGCCQGYWSFAAKDAGALYVHGIDASEAFIREAQAAKFMLGKGGCEFSEGDLEDPATWKGLEPREVTLLLGCLYHTTDPIYVLRQAMAITKETLVIDGEVVPGTEAFWKTVKRTSGEPTTVRSGLRSGLRTIPSVAAISALLEEGGFKKIQVLKPGPEMPPDYHAATTVSIIASRT